MAPSRHDWKIVDWDVKPQHKQTKLDLQVVFSNSSVGFKAGNNIHCQIIWSHNKLGSLSITKTSPDTLLLICE